LLGGYKDSSGGDGRHCLFPSWCWRLQSLASFGAANFKIYNIELDQSPEAKSPSQQLR